jgi:molybdopterin molybdotransferase
MRGFRDRALVETALAWIDEHARRLEAETVPLDDLHGRVLAESVCAAIDSPPFDRSAMDGYALCGAETIGAGPYHPLSFRILGESLPGRGFAGTVQTGTAVRIMTGAPIPDGADAVLPAEFASEAEGSVDITTPVTPGKNVGCRGEDVRAGTIMLTAGRRLRPQDVGLAASVGACTVSVVRRPAVRLLITGNELVAPGAARQPLQIFDANSDMLRGLVARDGGLVDSVDRLADDPEAIRRRLTAAGADVILVSGGSSVGAEDHAPTIVAGLGELAAHGIAMRPSSPAGIGRIGNCLVFLLPGNPVSCLCAYDFFAGRALRLLGGRSAEWPYATQRATVSKKIVSAIGRVDYCRIRLTDAGLEPLALSGASILSSTTRADGFVVIPAECEGYAPGETVTTFLYDPIA